MFTITRAQLEKFELIEKEKFHHKNYRFIYLNFPEWAKDKSVEEITKMIDDIYSWAKSIGIFREINVQKLLGCHLAYGLRPGDEKNLLPELVAERWHEDHRVEAVLIKLQSGNHQKKVLKLNHIPNPLTQVP